MWDDVIGGIPLLRDRFKRDSGQNKLEKMFIVLHVIYYIITKKKKIVYTSTYSYINKKKKISNIHNISFIFTNIDNYRFHFLLICTYNR